MITDLFTTLTRALSSNFEIALLAAFAWGILSILLSPCHLSSIPLIVGYVSSQGTVSVRKSFHLSFIFALGVLVTIALIGFVTASLGRLIGDIGLVGNLLVALIFIIIGLYLLDIVELSWNGLNVKTKMKGVPGAAILGLLFGIGLGPCTFAYLAPVLGSVLHISQSSLVKANLLIFAFGIGHISVIVSAGSVSSWVQGYLNWTGNSRAVLIVKRICGVLVIIGGFYLIQQTL